MRVRTFFLFVSPLLLAGVLLGMALRPSLGGRLYWNDRVRAEVQGIVGDRYVEPLQPQEEQELFDAAMRAYVGSLDPFSRYFTPDERRELEEDTSGSFAGIGVQVREVVAGLLVSAVYRDGPADDAGLLPGDILTAVDGIAIVRESVEDAVVRLRGEAGTEVTLDVVRNGRPPEPHVVRRGLVGLDTVPSVRMLPGTPPVAYVRVAQFSDTTPAEVRDGLERLTKDGAVAIVLDLRRNLGGVVSAAVEMAALFLPSGSVVCVTRERNRQRSYVIDEETAALGGADSDEDLHGPVAPGGPEPREDGAPPFAQPLIVLVDEGSASASEILAGALQDHGRALLVGDRTYGKFLVQTLLPLRSSDALVRITTARYETPRGRSGQRRPDGVRGGIMPDVRIDLTDDQLRAVLGAFRDQAGPRWRQLEGRNADADGSDAQLRAAVDILRGGDPPAETLRPAPTERG